MTEQQINQIAVNINTVLDEAKDDIRAFEERIDNEYLQGRARYPLTAIVYSAFSVEEQNIPGLRVQKVQYGFIKKMFLPALTNDEMYIEVFGDTAAPWKNDEVKQKYSEMGNRFHLLIFSINKEEYRLKKLQLLSFDGFDNKGNVHISNRKTIYKAQ